VVEKPSELELILDEAARLNITPRIGVRRVWQPRVPVNGKPAA